MERSTASIKFFISFFTQHCQPIGQHVTSEYAWVNVRALLKVMVLRGTKVSPDEGLIAAKEHVRDARESYEQAQLDLQEAEEALSHVASDREGLRQKSKGELVQLVISMQNEMDALKKVDTTGATLFNTSATVDRIVRQLACGGCAGAISRTFVAPIDRVKILLQTQHVTSGGAPDKYGGVVGTFKKIVNEEGIAKLWRGNGTNVIRVLPYSATQFTAYDT